MPLPVRNFQADLKRTAGAELLPPRPDPKADPTTYNPAGGTAAAALSTASGPTASRIVSVARGLLGHWNDEFLTGAPSVDPGNACASFVSTVLLRARATQGREQVVGPGFTRSAAELTSVTEAAGAVLVGGPMPLTAANVLKAQPGDVVQWFEGRRIGHSGIAIGGGRTIAISASGSRIETYAINYRRNPFTAFQLHRFTR